MSPKAAKLLFGVVWFLLVACSVVPNVSAIAEIEEPPEAAAPQTGARPNQPVKISIASSIPAGLVLQNNVWIVNDVPFTGKGVIEWTNGFRYEGIFANGRRTGKGIHTGTDSTGTSFSYVGDFVVGRYHGKGRTIWDNSHRYEGDYENNRRTGKGTYTWPNGARYYGDFVDNQRTGKGVFTWPDGSRYYGDWVDGKRHGKGIYTGTTSTGVSYSYDGDWVTEKWHGKGLLIWSNGHRYDGDFVEGYRTGYGVYRFADGREQRGRFLKGQYLGP